MGDVLWAGGQRAMCERTAGRRVGLHKGSLVTTADTGASSHFHTIIAQRPKDLRGVKQCKQSSDLRET